MTCSQICLLPPDTGHPEGRATAVTLTSSTTHSSWQAVGDQRAFTELNLFSWHVLKKKKKVAKIFLLLSVHHDGNPLFWLLLL